METRKAWRNRDASAAQAVLGLLEALRGGLGADAVGLFDDDRSDSVAEGVARQQGLNFWDSFGAEACAPLEWDGWYRTLRGQGRVDGPCRCGEGHRLHGFMIHGRWALLLVAPPVVALGGAAAIASSLHALAEKLPGAMTPDERRQAELAREFDEPLPTRATTGAPVWWIRRRPR